MGCVSSKHDRSPRPNIFQVENVDDAGQSLSPGQLEVTDTELVYHQRSGAAGGPPTTTHWQLCYLRKYGFDSQIFSFECGRRCPTGAGIYAFRCKKAETLFNMLQHSIQVGNLTDERRMTSAGGITASPGDYPIPMASNGPPVPNRVLPGSAASGGPQPLDGGSYLNPSGTTATGTIRTHTVRPDSVTSNGGLGGGPNSPVSPISPQPTAFLPNGDVMGAGGVVEWNNNKRGSLCGGTQQQGTAVANGYSNAQVVMEQQQIAAAQATGNGAPTYINLIPTAVSAPTPGVLMNNSMSLSNAPTVPCTPTPFDNTYVNVTTNNATNAYMNITCQPQTPGPHDMHTFAALMLPPPPSKIMGVESPDDRQHCYINIVDPLMSSSTSMPIWRGPSGSVPSTPTVAGNYAELDLPSKFNPQMVSSTTYTSLISSVPLTSTAPPPFIVTNPTPSLLSAPDPHDTSAAKPYVTIDWRATTALTQTRTNQQLVDTDKGSRKTRHNSTIGDAMPIARQSSSQSD